MSKRLPGETLKTILDLPRYYDELSGGLKGRVADDFGKYGMELVDFIIGAITPPEEVQKTRLPAVTDENIQRLKLDVDKIAAAAPANRQTLLFTATMDDVMAKLAQRLLKDPMRIEIAGQKTSHDQIEQRLRLWLTSQGILPKEFRPHRIDGSKI